MEIISLSLVNMVFDLLPSVSRQYGDRINLKKPGCTQVILGRRYILLCKDILKLIFWYVPCFMLCDYV